MPQNSFWSMYVEVITKLVNQSRFKKMFHGMFNHLYLECFLSDFNSFTFFRVLEMFSIKYMLKISIRLKFDDFITHFVKQVHARGNENCSFLTTTVNFPRFRFDFGFQTCALTPGVWDYYWTIDKRCNFFLHPPYSFL